MWMADEEEQELEQKRRLQEEEEGLAPETELAYQRASDAQAELAERIKEIPDLPKPSVWRKLAAAGAGFAGGYFGDRIDPRITQQATQRLMFGNLPERQALADARIRAAQAKVSAANTTAGQATFRQNALDSAKERKRATLEREQRAKMEQGTRKDIETARRQASLAQRGAKELLPEEMESPELQQQAKDGLVILTKVGNATYAVPTAKGVAAAKNAEQENARLTDEELGTLSSIYQRRYGVPLPKNMSKQGVDLFSKAIAEMGRDNRQNISLSLRDDKADARAAEKARELAVAATRAYEKRQQDRELAKARDLRMLDNNTYMKPSEKEQRKREVIERYNNMGMEDNSNYLDYLEQVKGVPRGTYESAKWKNQKGGDPTVGGGGASGGAPAQGGGKVVDDETLARYVNEAGGNTQKALEKLARDGYKVN